jgi:thymidylate synthase ThyX
MVMLYIFILILLKEDKIFIPTDWPQEWRGRLEVFSENANHLYHKALEELTPLLGRKRAKESARFFKSFNSQISLDIMFNFRSFVHFYHLRADEHAQKEVRELAHQMLGLIKDIEGNPFKHTLEAFKL